MGTSSCRYCGQPFNVGPNHPDFFPFLNVSELFSRLVHLLEAANQSLSQPTTVIRQARYFRCLMPPWLMKVAGRQGACYRRPFDTADAIGSNNAKYIL